MTRAVNPYAYNITVREIDFDSAPHFEARVKELPDGREYGASYGEAYELASDTIETAAAMFDEERRSSPPPAGVQEDFSGRVTLRLPKSLHRALADRAVDQGVSLNRSTPGQRVDLRSRIEDRGHDLGARSRFRHSRRDANCDHG